MRLIRLRHHKGFTLVECIIAIAVFAVMTSMVLLIMSGTIKLSKKATDSEAGLNELVQNVVQDNSNKTYGDDSKILEMDFGGAASPNFRITYSTTDGARTMLRCPINEGAPDGDANKGCGEIANVLEYMEYIYSSANYLTSSDSEKNNCRISYWFDPSDAAVNKYICPNCGKNFGQDDVYLECLGCLFGAPEGTGYPAKASDFIYDRSSGGYVCPKCQSGHVTQIIYSEPSNSGNTMPITEVNEHSNYDFKINGIQSNAIRYGKIDAPDNDTIKSFSNINAPASTDVKCSTTISYQKNSNGAAGIYTLTISSVTNLNDGDAATYSIDLPGAYVVRLLGSSNINVGDPSKPYDADKPSATVIESKEYDDPSETSAISVTNITTTNSNNIVIKFTLCNYANNNSFDDDYSADGGLTKFWYGSTATSATFNVPREDLS